MKLVILCPWCASGGPEALHQLCQISNELGHDASILYDNAPHEELVTFFGDVYPLAKRTLHAEDDPHTIVVVPETYRLDTGNAALFPTSTIIVWWLSLDLGMPQLAHFLQYPNTYFVCQSNYAMHAVGSLCRNRSFMLTDFVRPITFPPCIKEDIVIYHARKDHATPYLCIRNNIPCKAIHNVDAEESQRIMHSAKVYCDLGSHPGTDRMPREAAMKQCVVITGKRGSASNDLDVPLKNKSDDPNEIVALIKNALANYESEYASQGPYRDWISGERARFTTEIVQIISYIAKRDEFAP
jgi:hypothetical protein